MAEYIERERLLRKFNIDDMMNVNGTLISLREARETISNFPAADAVPRELFDKLLKDMCEMCFMWGDGLCPFCEWKEYRTDANEPNRA